MSINKILVCVQFFSVLKERYLIMTRVRKGNLRWEIVEEGLVGFFNSPLHSLSSDVPRSKSTNRFPRRRPALLTSPAAPIVPPFPAKPCLSPRHRPPPGGREHARQVPQRAVPCLRRPLPVRSLGLHGRPPAPRVLEAARPRVRVRAAASASPLAVRPGLHAARLSRARRVSTEWSLYPCDWFSSLSILAHASQPGYRWPGFIYAIVQCLVTWFNLAWLLWDIVWLLVSKHEPKKNLQINLQILYNIYDLVLSEKISKIQIRNRFSD
jgi:hypothetical protein